MGGGDCRWRVFLLVGITVEAGFMPIDPGNVTLMSLNQYSGTDVVNQRKAEVRKRMKVAAGSAIIGLPAIIGAVALQSVLLTIIGAVAVIVFIYSGFKIREVTSHKDKW